MTYEHQLERNVYLLFGLKAAKWFMLFMPVVVLFFMENGLTVKQIMLAQAAYSLSVAFFELPSGYFSDKLGRRLTLIIGMLLTMAGYVIMGLADGFWWFIAAEITMGLGGSFVSGTDSALLYDSLLQLKRQDRYLKLEGRMYSVCTFSEAVAAIFGGWIASQFGMRATIWAFLGVLSIGLICTWMLVEPQVVKQAENPRSTRPKDILHYVFIENKYLRWFVILSGSIGAATLTMAWFTQVYMEYIGLSLTTIGWLWSALNLTVAIFAFLAHYVYRFLTKFQVVVLIVLGIIVGYAGLGMSYNVVGLAFIFLIYIVRGIATPVLKDFVNERTPSEMRATVLSIRGLIIRVVFSTLAPFLGWINDTYTLQQAFMLAAATFGILGLMSLFMLKWGVKNNATMR